MVSNAGKFLNDAEVILTIALLCNSILLNCCKLLPNVQGAILTIALSFNRKSVKFGKLLNVFVTKLLILL